MLDEPCLGAPRKVCDADAGAVVTRNLESLLPPPERAAVLYVAEGSPIQALNRTEPDLPLRPGLSEQRKQDDKRNETTSLFVALNTATKTVIGKCSRRDRSVELKKFPAIIDKRVLSELEILLELDNNGTHKAEMIHNWLPRQPPFHLRFTPTSASWLNHVERRFAEITRQSIRRGSFRSTKALEQAIEDYNENPKPIVGTKAADEILESVESYSRRIPHNKH